MKKHLDVECPNCGNWESQPADQQRHHIKTFDHVENLKDGNAIYKCECGSSVTSTILSDEKTSEDKFWDNLATFNERFTE